METKHIETKEELESAVNAFLESAETSANYTVHQKLRHELRNYINKYPGQYYHLALNGLPEGYYLTMSKKPIELKWETLTKKTREMVEKFSQLKSLDEIYDQWTNAKHWKKLAIEAILALGSEKDWQNKHYDYENQIQKYLMKSSNYPKWKELVLSTDYTKQIK